MVQKVTKIFIVLLSIFLFAPAVYAQSVVTPTLYCLGSCVYDTTPTPSVTITATVPVTSTTAPSTTAAVSTTTAPTATINPCANGEASIADRGRGHKHHRKGGRGFFQQFMQFIMQLLARLFELILGGKTPVPQPGGGGNTPSVTPSISPCVSLVPPSTVAPSVNPVSPTVPVITTPGTTVSPTTPVSGGTCTNPTHTIPMNPSNPQDGITIGNFYLTNDTWNAANYTVSQTMYICDYNNWYVVASMNNTGDGAVKTYPNIHQDFNGKAISSFSTITSSFAESGPHVGIYEYAYDIWLNGIASNGSTEVMIWNDNYGQTPSGSQVGTFSDNGRTYKVYKTGNYIAFVDSANVTSGTVNLKNFFNYIIQQGWIASTSTVGQIDYGIELVSTNGSPATFKVTNFSLTAN